MADVFVNTVNCCGVLFKGVKWLIHRPAATSISQSSKTAKKLLNYNHKTHAPSYNLNLVLDRFKFDGMCFVIII